VTRDVTNERNEFQDFIWASTGQVLPVYGQNLFEAPSTFAPVEISSAASGSIARIWLVFFTCAWRCAR
jgi:hypothetical protein